MNELSAYEQQRFTLCKETISSGIQTCFDVGLALTEIRDSRLYREDFNTFEEFTQKNYQISAPHAYRLIGASEIKLSPIGESIQNEAQARAIAKVPEEKRESVMKTVIENGKVTAAGIDWIAKQSNEPLTATAITKAMSEQHILDVDHHDELGKPIPANVQPLWDKAYAESRDMLFEISSLRNKFKRAQAEKNPAYAEIRFQENIGLLTTLHANVKLIAPYAVCPRCNGKGDLDMRNDVRFDCDLCKGRGYLSQFAFKMFGNV